MLLQHLVCKYELNCEYCNITLARNKAPWLWSDKIETCRSVLKCFIVHRFIILLLLIVLTQRSWHALRLKIPAPYCGMALLYLRIRNVYSPIQNIHAIRSLRQIPCKTSPTELVVLPASRVVLLQERKFVYIENNTDNETARLKFWSTLKLALPQAATSVMTEHGFSAIFSCLFSEQILVHELFPHLLTTVQGPLFIQEFKAFAFQKMVLFPLRLSGFFKLNIPSKGQVFPLHVTNFNT